MKEHLKQTWYWHLMVWVLLFFILTSIPNLNFFYFSKSKGTLFYPFLTSTPFTILFFYGNALLYEKYVFNLKKPVKYFLSLLVLYVATLIPRVISDLIWVEVYIDTLKTLKENVSWMTRAAFLMFFNTISIFFFYIFSFGWSYFVQYVVVAKRNRELERAALETELLFLKSQLNPHFLFNTLNYFYAEALKNKNTKLSNSVLKLSDMMRYMLYETNVSAIPLEKEIAYIHSYLELYGTRYRKTLEDMVKWTVSGDVSSFKIAPMLLISFVENAMKYSESGIGDVQVTIAFKVENNQLHFDVTNRIAENKIKTSHSGGLGLVNVQKRLDYIYNSGYALDIHSDQQMFYVSLQLKTL